MKKPKKRAPAGRAADKSPRKPSRAAGARAPRQLSAEFIEELEAALIELRRLSLELVHARRDLLAEESTARGVETSLRRELDHVRTALQTARADLEIAQGNTRRIEMRLEAAAEAEARAREAQRQAEHAADRARDELLFLRREVDRLSGRPVTAAAAVPAPRGED